MEAPRTMFKVVEEIVQAVQAVQTAGQNKERCQDIGDSARAIRDILKNTAYGSAYLGESTRMPGVDRLEVILDDALQLVKSQSGLYACITGGATDASFQDVEKKINACVNSLGLGQLFDSRRRAIRAERAASTVLHGSNGAVNVRQQPDWMAGGNRQLQNHGAGNVRQQQDRMAGGNRQVQNYGAGNVRQQQDRMAGDNRQVQNYGAVNVRQQPDWMAGGSRQPLSTGQGSSQPALLPSSQQRSSQSALQPPSSRQQSSLSALQPPSSQQQSSQSALQPLSSRQQSSLSAMQSPSAGQQSSRSAPQPPSTGQQRSRSAARGS